MLRRRLAKVIAFLVAFLLKHRRSDIWSNRLDKGRQCSRVIIAPGGNYSNERIPIVETFNVTFLTKVSLLSSTGFDDQQLLNQLKNFTITYI